MTQKYDADVAIVGYGPTGVVAALTLVAAEPKRQPDHTA